MSQHGACRCAEMRYASRYLWDGRGWRRFHLGAVGGAGGDVGVVVGVVHQPGSGSLSDSGGRKAARADQARRLTSSTEADWGGRSHGGPGHGVALPAAERLGQGEHGAARRLPEAVLLLGSKK